MTINAEIQSGFEGKRLHKLNDECSDNIENKYYNNVARMSVFGKHR